MVRIYSRATAGVVGGLQSVSKHPGPERACRGPNTPQLVASSSSPKPVERRQLEGSDLEPRAGAAGSSSDVGAYDGRSGTQCSERAVGVVDIFATTGGGVHS